MANSEWFMKLLSYERSTELSIIFLVESNDFPILVKCSVQWTLPIAQAIMFNSGSVSNVNFVKFKSLISFGIFFMFFIINNFHTKWTSCRVSPYVRSYPDHSGYQRWESKTHFLFINIRIWFIKLTNRSWMNIRIMLLNFFPWMTFDRSII